MFEPISLRGKADKEVGIHCVVQIFIKPVLFGENSAPKEGGGGGNIEYAMIIQDKAIEFNLLAGFDNAAEFVHQGVVAIDDIYFRIKSECPHNSFEAARPITIVNLSQPTISPVASWNPLFRAALCPLSGSELQIRCLHLELRFRASEYSVSGRLNHRR